tara:strand:+ start:265 stop:540 length:276 start_codon:yes stop_codon:yes gene_type:complete
MLRTKYNKGKRPVKSRKLRSTKKMIHKSRKLRSTKKMMTKKRRSRKQIGGWGITNALRGIQYNLVKLGNGFTGQNTPVANNPYPTQGQFST